MGKCKEIIIKVIPKKIADEFVKKHHYSGKIVPNSQLHFGCFFNGSLHGVLQYGPSMDKKKTIKLVAGTSWNGFLELNRMAFDEVLPRNSESFCIAKTLKMIKKQAPQVKWVISFADATQCGDGTIYRASNFLLTQIKKNKSILRFPNGETVCKLSIDIGDRQEFLKRQSKLLGVDFRYRRPAEWVALGAEFIEGFQLRYIYFIDKKYQKNLTCEVLPYTAIDDMHAGMYRGEVCSRSERHAKKTEK